MGKGAEWHNTQFCGLRSTRATQQGRWKPITKDRKNNTPVTPTLIQAGANTTSISSSRRDAITTERSADVKRFVALVRRYTAIEELTYENVHEFIDRILIHELDKETNTRKIEIFYSFVGRVDTGDKPTESISYFRQIGADVKSYAI